MADLDQIVDLGAVVDQGVSDRSAVNAGVGLNIDVGADENGSGLWDFMPASEFIFGKAEAVCSDDGSVFEGDMVAKLAALADNGVGVGEEMVANGHVAIEDDVRQDGGVCADVDIGREDSVGTDVSAGTKRSGGIDDRSGVYARSVGGRLIKEGKSLGEGEIGIVKPEGRDVEVRKIRGDENGGGAGGARKGAVFGVGDKGEFGWTGVFKAAHCGNDDGSVAV